MPVTEYPELKRIFERDILPNLSKLQKRLDKEHLIAWVLVVGFVFTWLAIVFEAKMIAPLAFAGMFLFAFLTAKDEKAHKESYRLLLDRYQKELVRPLIAAVDTKLNYYPDRGLTYADILNSQQIHSASHKKFTSNNLIQYTNEGLPVKLAHVDLRYLYEDDEEKEYRRVLGGLFVTAQSRRPVTGTTIVTFDISERLLGFVGKSLQKREMSGGLRRVYLDNPAFEKEFVVYSTDPIEANYLLSFTVMEQLTRLTKQYGVLTRFSFSGDKIYFNVSTGGFFQPYVSLGTQPQLRSFEDVQASLNGLYFIHDAIEAIHHHHKL